MSWALIDPANPGNGQGRVADVQAQPFAVSPPLYWVDLGANLQGVAPDQWINTTATQGSDVLQAVLPDGATIANTSGAAGAGKPTYAQPAVGYGLGGFNGELVYASSLINLLAVDTSGSTSGSGAGTARDFRQLITAPYFASALPSSFVVTFAAPTNRDWTIDACYVGYRASSGNDYDFDGNQVQVTFAGSTSVTITAGGNTQISDPISLPSPAAAGTTLVVATHVTFSGASALAPGSQSGQYPGCIAYSNVDAAAGGEAALTVASAGYSTLLSDGIFWVSSLDQSSSTAQLALLSSGTAGQIAKSQGAGLAPAWTNIANLLAAGSGISISGTTTATISSSGTVTPPGGRLTLVTATPVMTSTQSAKTTVYYTPYVHQFVPLYNGTSFSMTDTGGELSQATTDNTKSPAAVAASKVYDIFVWSDSGTMRATRGPAWSSDTSRGTGAGTSELTQVNGVWLNANAITNGPGASRGTYVGTIRSNGSSQIDWIYGASAAGGTAGFFGVWNCYNRVEVATQVQDSTASWTYNSATWRSSDNSAAMRVTYVYGLNEDGVVADFVISGAGGGAGNAPSAGIGIDSTSAVSGVWYAINTGSSVGSMPARYAGNPGLGVHFVQAIEANAGSSPTTAATYRGSTAIGSGGSSVNAGASGLSVTLRM